MPAKSCFLGFFSFFSDAEKAGWSVFSAFLFPFHIKKKKAVRFRVFGIFSEIKNKNCILEKRKKRENAIIRKKKRGIRKIW
jgi:hypothetical protein